MKISRFNPDSDIEDILTAIKQDGVAIVEQLVDESVCQAVSEEIQPILEAVPYGWEPFIGFRTKRFGALASRVPACHPLITNPVILETVERFLSPYTDKVYLNSTQFIVPYNGQKDQVLHRDRDSWLYLPDNMEPQLNIIWGISDFTKDNGATRFALGSHNWPTDRQAEEEICRATMPKGSALIFTGGVVHGGGANNSVVPRIGLAFSYCLAWLRAEENQFLSCPPEIARDLDPKLQDLLGYTTMSGALGYYSDPYAAPDEAGIRPPEIALGKEVPEETKPG